MKVFENKDYIYDVKYVASLDLPWELMSGKSVLISGASGLVGSFLVDVLMERNSYGMNCKIFALSRNIDRARERFSYCTNNALLRLIECDISKPLVQNDIGTVDYVIHLASNTHPLQYSTDPIGTISTNIFGLYNMLQFAKEHNATRCAFASSNEIYGENRGDVELFDEHYCGYLDSNSLRAGYSESKRCGEALCQAFIKQNNLDIVIPRLTRTYGPTMLSTDSKAISQFIKKALYEEDIVLKSAGNQFYSYTYVADAVSGLLTVLLNGSCGEAYNIADEESDIMLKDLARAIAELVGKNVVFEIPDEVEALGYSKATKARMNGEKLKKLGWKAKYDIHSGLERTIEILKSVDGI